MSRSTSECRFSLICRHVFILCVGFSFTSGLAAEAADEPKSLSEELPRIAATPVEKALSTFTVQQDFRLELVASEPHVSDPVDACFDEYGRMFVAEMHGYPFSQEPTRLNPKGGGKADAGVIRLLEDTNGDGRFDRSVKFADGIRWPTSVCCFDGGVYVLAPPNIWYFKDMDDDGVADVRKVVFEGFNRDNVQAVANNLKWGLDHRIYGAGGRNPSVMKRDGKDVLRLGRNDFSFDPVSHAVRAETGGVQFGHSFDDWGNRFVCSNSNHIRQVVYATRYLSRNPSYPVSNPIPSISKEGAAAPVFRRSSAEPWRIVRTRRRVADPRFKGLPATERVPIGFFTSATSVTVYRGDAWPEEFRNQVFIGDVGGNLVHRKTLTPNGPAFLATRADAGVEFIASTDNWFRPTNFVNAPDGTLYVLDMYRETIEHPYSIPDDIKEYLNLESGDDRGRIYRLLGPNGKRLPVKPLGGLSTTDLVQKLDSPNVWTRDTAHRLLYERHDEKAVPALRHLAKHGQLAQARVHALWSLAAFDIRDEDIRSALQDSDPHVRRHALRLAEDSLGRSPALINDLMKMTQTEADRGVLFQLALSIGASTDSAIADGVTGLLRRSDRGAEIRIGALISAWRTSEAVLLNVLKDSTLRERAVREGWIADLAHTVTGDPKHADLAKVLTAVFDDSIPAHVQRAVLKASADSLARRGQSFRKWLADPSRADLAAVTDVYLTDSAKTVTDKDKAVGDRIAAAGMLTLADAEQALNTLPKVLTPATPQSLQIAAVQTLSKHSATAVAEILLERWRGFSPLVRVEALAALMSTVDRTTKLLNAFEEGTVRSAELAADRRQLLLNHPNSKIRERAKKLLGSSVNSNRAAVVAEYQPALELNPDIQRGRKFFLKKCSVCHRVEKQGHQVGPDIVSVQNKSPADLLIAILDPNREAQPNFNSYTVITDEGRILNGIIAAETATTITLRRAEGKQDIVERSTIDELISSGKSMMPEGLEKDVDKQQLADLLAFIKSLGGKK